MHDFPGGVTIYTLNIYSKTAKPIYSKVLQYLK